MNDRKMWLTAWAAVSVLWTLYWLGMSAALGGEAIRDMLAELPWPLLVAGLVLSIPAALYLVGAVIGCLAGGSKGKRFALPHSKIMVHQPWGQVGGQVSDIEIQANEILKDRHRLNLILAKHTGQPIEAIEKETERDRYFSAQEAKEFGLVDEVLSKPPDEKKK